MTVETNIADSQIENYLSEIDRFMADYRGGYPRVNAIMGYFQDELNDYKRVKKIKKCPVCPELKECPHADNRTECWEYDKAMMKAGEK